MRQSLSGETLALTIPTTALSPLNLRSDDLHHQHPQSQMLQKAICPKELSLLHQSPPQSWNLIAPTSLALGSQLAPRD